MKNLITAIIASAGLVSTTVLADDALLKKYNCLACHANNAKKVGPAYNEVAKKYASKGDAVAYLSGKIKAGDLS